MKQLTKAEDEVMQILWRLEKAFVRDIIEEFPEPKPAYNSISTFVRILEKKEFVGFEAFGKSHRYYPLISKEEYTRSFMKGIVNNYFSGSYSNLVSFFTKQDNLSVNELESLIKELKRNDNA